MCMIVCSGFYLYFVLVCLVYFILLLFVVLLSLYVVVLETTFLYRSIGAVSGSRVLYPNFLLDS